MNARRRSGIAVLAAVTAVSPLVGCGSDGPDVYTAPQASTDETTPPAGSVPVGSTPEDAAADGAAADGAPPSEPVPPNGEVVEVRALDNSFIEEVVEVEAGTEIHWQNRGRNDHDVVPVDDGEDWGVELESFTPGDSYSRVFSTPGTYRYYCTIHGTEDVGMIGTIVVS